MAFPGTYNISYYKGDTLEFKIYPKDSTGSSFNLTGYGTPKFTIAVARGSAGLAGGQVQIEGTAATYASDGYILCTITPGNGAAMTAGTSYVYDVQISKTGYTYTLLTGSISVTDQVTGATA